MKLRLESLVVNNPFEIIGVIRVHIKVIKIIMKKFQRQSQRRAKYTVYSIVRFTENLYKGWFTRSDFY